MKIKLVGALPQKLKDLGLKPEHRPFRSTILQIHEPISEQLDKLSTEKLPTLF